MRRCFLVCYDISNPQRLRRMFKVMKGYGEHWQLSVFFCVLKAIDRVRLEAAIMRVVNQREDQVMILDLGPDEEAARRAAFTIGPPLPGAPPSMMIV
jgi:CRISPR-associated protein Cas2